MSVEGNVIRTNMEKKAYRMHPPGVFLAAPGFGVAVPEGYIPTTYKNAGTLPMGSRRLLKTE
jgi:hypothetical protein